VTINFQAAALLQQIITPATKSWTTTTLRPGHYFHTVASYYYTATTTTKSRKIIRNATTSLVRKQYIYILIVAMKLVLLPKDCNAAVGVVRRPACCLTFSLAFLIICPSFLAVKRWVGEACCRRKGRDKGHMGTCSIWSCCPWNECWMMSRGQMIRVARRQWQWSGCCHRDNILVLWCCMNTLNTLVCTTCPWGICSSIRHQRSSIGSSSNHRRSIGSMRRRSSSCSSSSGSRPHQRKFNILACWATTPKGIGSISTLGISFHLLRVVRR